MKRRSNSKIFARWQNFQLKQLNALAAKACFHSHLTITAQKKAKETAPGLKGEPFRRRSDPSKAPPNPIQYAISEVSNFNNTLHISLLVFRGTKVQSKYDSFFLGNQTAITALSLMFALD